MAPSETSAAMRLTSVLSLAPASVLPVTLPRISKPSAILAGSVESMMTGMPVFVCRSSSVAM